MGKFLEVILLDGGVNTYVVLLYSVKLSSAMSFCIPTSKTVPEKPNMLTFILT